MALNTASIVSNAKTKLAAKGFVLDNEHSKQTEIIEAIVEAIVEDIQANARVSDPGGTSPGQWKIT